MIHELLNPRFLRSQLERLEHHGNGRLEPGHYSEMYDELDRAAADQSVPPLVAGERPPAVAHMSRNPKVSIFQSILEHCIDTRLPQIARKLLHRESPVAEWSLGEHDLFRQFGPCDPGWIECKLSEGIDLIERKPEFPDGAPEPVPIADRARVIVVGDWGTGLPQAVMVAAQMRRVIVQSRTEGVKQQHVIHLGDTYYSGWKEEYARRFLPHWPVAPTERDLHSWTLNGNHDMYSGGHGYFGFLLHDPRFAAQQGSSHFALQSADWQIVALDSSFKEGDLAGHQADWLARLVSGSRRKTMLLTHHEPFSRYERADWPLQATVEQALHGERVDAWLWGHEHRCAVYDRGLVDYAGFTSVIGHGGVPALAPRSKSAPAGVSWQFDGFYEGEDDSWSLCGFAVLDFDGPEVQVRYVDEHGATNHTETISRA